MIGHLQTNKVKYIIDKVCLIQLGGFFPAGGGNQPKKSGAARHRDGRSRSGKRRLRRSQIRRRYGCSGNSGEGNLGKLQQHTCQRSDDELLLMRKIRRKYGRIFARCVSCTTDLRGISAILPWILNTFPWGCQMTELSRSEEGSTVIRVGAGVFGARGSTYRKSIGKPETGRYF